jgi:hypothetical protein
MSSLDANQIPKYEQVFLDNEDKLDDFTDLFDFMQQCNKIIEARCKLSGNAGIIQKKVIYKSSGYFWTLFFKKLVFIFLF